MKRRCHYVACAFLVILLAPTANAEQRITLPSGETFEILGIGNIHSSSGETFLSLKYRTQTPIEDYNNLRKESDSIWNEFVVNVEKDGRDTAVIMAMGSEKGFIVTTSRSHNFVYRKKNGLWRTLEEKSENSVKWDNTRIEAFFDRIDWLEKHNKINSLLLYLSRDWTKNIVDSTKTPPKTTVLSRDQYASEVHRAMSSSSSYTQQRDILDIRIDEDRRIASTESLIREEVIINGIKYSALARSTDVLTVDGDSTIWTRSSSVIQEYNETRIK